MKSGGPSNVLTSGQCASVLKALGDATRLRILESLLVEDKCVSELVQELKCPQPHASHHLRILRDTGLVEGHRAGKQVWYRITPSVQRALANRQGQALNFGCCELRFPQSTLLHLDRNR
ncbi:MAG: hypothetical protein ABS70_00260 [Nitrospira sp. SCN 59-13]|nr:MAG: hypothetical protein ABS70_00260 [Nitrospira sp. SCN 59-13]